MPDAKQGRGIAAGLILTTAAIAVWTVSGCGFKPPKEFNNVAKSDPSEFNLPKAGDAGSDSDASVGEEVPALSSGGRIYIGMGLAAIPALPISQLLGKQQEDIETLFKPLEPETDEQKAAAEAAAAQGWIQYSTHLRVKYENAVAVELEQQVPPKMSCSDAARWIGFSEVGEAQESDSKCEWPEGDAGHALGQGTHGKLDKKKNLFTARAPAPPVTE